MQIKCTAHQKQKQIRKVTIKHSPRRQYLPIQFDFIANTSQCLSILCYNRWKYTIQCSVPINKQVDNIWFCCVKRRFLYKSFFLNSFFIAEFIFVLNTKKTKKSLNQIEMFQKDSNDIERGSALWTNFGHLQRKKSLKIKHCKRTSLETHLHENKIDLHLSWV